MYEEKKLLPLLRLFIVQAVNTVKSKYSLALLIVTTDQFHIQKLREATFMST